MNNAASQMKFGVVVFPASNCDRDCYDVLSRVFGVQVDYLWHKDHQSLDAYDGLIIPGGFAYGDYLRAGAMARHSVIMNDVITFANNGGLVAGICNGFQILVEAELLPGALMTNASLKFISKTTPLEVCRYDTAFTKACPEGQHLYMPIAHHQGNYYANEKILDALEQEGRVLFRYAGANPNGSSRSIAGIINQAGNVMGMMPHPDRSAEAVIGSKDGYFIFQSMLNHLRGEVTYKGKNAFPPPQAKLAEPPPLRRR